LLQSLMNNRPPCHCVERDHSGNLGVKKMLLFKLGGLLEGMAKKVSVIGYLRKILRVNGRELMGGRFSQV